MTVALDWPTQLQPIWSDDLGDYVAAIATMWTEVELYQADPANDVASWQVLLDIDRAPTAALPWLAQCVGERLMVGHDDAVARDRIRNSPTWIRGTPQGIWNAVKEALAPGAQLMMRERHKLDGTFDVDWLALQTYASGTPDETLVRRALRATVPADIMVDYQLATAATWATVIASSATWGAVKATYPTWGDLQGSFPGYITWS
jgi:hypothetical protein